MNKRLSLIMALVLAMSLLLTACGPNTISYMEKTAETEKWEATEGKIAAKIVMEITEPVPTPEGGLGEEKGETMKIEIPMDMDLYMVGQEKGKVDIKYDFTGVKALAPTEEEAKVFPDNIEFTVYVDGNKAIMPKEIFTMGIPGATVPKVIDGPEKYIALDMSEFGIGEEGVEDTAEEFVEVIEKIYEGYKSDFDMEKDGDKFSYELTIEDGAKEIKSLVKFTKENAEAIFKALDAFVVTIDKENAETNKAMLGQAKTALMEIKDEDIEELTAEMTRALKGSKISEVTEFKEDAVDQQLNFVLKIEDLMSMDMNMTAKTKKAAVKAIEIPTDVKVIKYSEYMMGIMSEAMEIEGVKPVLVNYNAEMIEFDTQPIIEDGRTLVPFRAFLEKLGATVEWDEENQVVTAKHDDKEIKLTIGSKIALVDGVEVELDKEAKLVDSRTLVPLRFISENFGFEVEFMDNEYGFIVNVMTPEFAEEIKAMGEDVE